MSLDRFKSAQDSAGAGFATALAELRAGRKTSHWIWYVFPQLAGLGRSSTAQLYGLRDLSAACDYLGDPMLRQRLELATAAVAAHLDSGAELAELMGGTTDALKLVSSLTLFERAANEGAASLASPADLRSLLGQVLTAAERQGFPRCPYTLAHAGGPSRG